MTEPTDLEQRDFEDEVREMLRRRAGDVDHLERRAGLRRQAQPRTTSMRSPLLLAAAAGVVVLGAAVALGLGALDGDGRSDTLTVAEDGASPPTEDLAASTTTQSTGPSTSGPSSTEPAAAGRPSWLTSTPSADQLPAGSLTDWSIVFTGEGEADDVVDAYLTDRFLTRDSQDVTADEVELVDNQALYRWQWGDEGREGRAGWIYLLRADGLWHVIASTTDGVDLSSVSRDSRGLSGTITSTGSDLLAADLFDLSTGEIFDPNTGEPILDDGTPPFATFGSGAGGPQPGVRFDVDQPVARQQYGLRVREIGGTVLSISEVSIEAVVRDTSLGVFVEPGAVALVAEVLAADARVVNYRELDAATTADYVLTSFSQAPEIAAIWDDRADLRAFEVALAPGSDEPAVTAALVAVDGVLGVAKPEWVELEPRQFDGSQLIAGTEDVETVPGVTTCAAPLGIETPPNEVTLLDQPLLAPSPEEALARFLDEADDTPPWTAGYVAYRLADGTVAYGYGEVEGVLLGTVTVVEADGGWTVSEWEIVGC